MADGLSLLDVDGRGAVQLGRNERLWLVSEQERQACVSGNGQRPEPATMLLVATALGALAIAPPQAATRLIGPPSDRCVPDRRA